VQFEANNRLLVKEAQRAGENCSKLVGYWKGLSASAEAFQEQSAIVAPMRDSVRTVQTEISALQGDMESLLEALELVRARKHARKLQLWEQHRVDSLAASEQRKSMLNRYKTAVDAAPSSTEEQKKTEAEAPEQEEGQGDRASGHGKEEETELP
jgi:hypothetical protein